ncbi:ADP-ribosyltransferase, partial [Streptomyces nigra]
PAIERLVRRVAVLLYHGHVHTAEHETTVSVQHVLAEPHPAFSRTAHPPRHNDNPAQHTPNSRPNLPPSVGLFGGTPTSGLPPTAALPAGGIWTSAVASSSSSAVPAAGPLPPMVLDRSAPPATVPDGLPVGTTIHELHRSYRNPYFEMHRQAFPNARTFATNAAASNFGGRYWTSHVRGLDPAMKLALRHYTNMPDAPWFPTWPYTPSYLEINALSRDNFAGTPKPYHLAEEVSQRFDPIGENGNYLTQNRNGKGTRIVRGEDFLLGAFQVTQQDLLALSAALRSRPVPEDLVVTKAVPHDYISKPWEQCVGHVFSDASFMSTSLGPPGVIDHPVVLHLLVPRGAPALYIAGVSWFPAERELLLDRGQRWRAMSVEQREGKIHVLGEILVA